MTDFEELQVSHYSAVEKLRECQANVDHMSSVIDVLVSLISEAPHDNDCLQWVDHGDGLRYLINDGDYCNCWKAALRSMSRFGPGNSGNT